MDWQKTPNFYFFLITFSLGILTLFLFTINGIALIRNSNISLLKILKETLERVYPWYLWIIHHKFLENLILYTTIIIVLISICIIGAFAYILGDLIPWIVLSKKINISPELLAKKIEENELEFSIEGSLKIRDFLNLKEENIWSKLSQKNFELSFFFGGVYASLVLATFILFIIWIFYKLGTTLDKSTNKNIMLNSWYLITIISLLLLLPITIWFSEKIKYTNKNTKPRGRLKKILKYVIPVLIILLIISPCLVSKQACNFETCIIIIDSIPVISFLPAIHLRQIADTYLLLAAKTNEHQLTRKLPPYS